MAQQQSPLENPEGLQQSSLIYPSSLVVVHGLPDACDSDDVQRSLRDACGSSNDCVSDVRVMKYGQGKLNIPSTMKYATASVRSAKDIAVVNPRVGLPECHVTTLFQEDVNAVFRIHPQICSSQPAQLGVMIQKQAQALGVQVAFEQTTVRAFGNCKQIHKFREYLAELTLQAVLHTSPSTEELVGGKGGIEVPPESMVPEDGSNSKVTQNNSFPDLSPDVLLLMSKLKQIPDLVYHPKEGRVEVTAATQEEREKCISIFQQAYQQIVNNRQLKSESLELSQPYPPEQMEKVLQEFNEKYHQCYFSYSSTSHSIKIVSMSSRQYDQAKKLIKERLSGKLPTSSALDLGKTQVLQLPNGRTLSVKRGDIAGEKADILVNAANSHLDHIAGVAGALNKASNGELQKHCNVYHHQYGDVPAGNVTVTKAGGKLKCKHVIHAVGPIASIHKSDIMCSQLIFDAVTNSLKKAQALKATSIAFPALSTGVYAVKRELAANAIFEAICTFNYTSNSMKDIRIVILDEPTYSCFALMLLQRGSMQEVDGLDKKPIGKPVYTRSLSDETSYTGHSNTSTSEGGAFRVSDLNNQPKTMSPNIRGTAPPGLNVNPSPPQHVVTTQPSGGMPDITWPELPSSITTGTTWDPHGHNLPPISSSSGDPNVQLGTHQWNTQTSTTDTFFKPPTFPSQTSPHHGPLKTTTSSTVHSKELLLPQKIINTAAKKKNSTSHVTVTSSSDAVTKTTMTTTTTPTPIPTPDTGNNTTNTSTSNTQGCPICLNEALTDPVAMHCCKNQFCRACIHQAMVHSPYCPTCKTPLRTVEGNQPLGSTMNHYTSRSSLPGYPNCGTITISYYVPYGTQGPEHPNPGLRYQGTSRTAYLPDNPEGREVLKLLQKAFQARLIFTVGTSTTSGRSNTVVWNDIHHKTNTHGGSSGYGYPDPTYLQRVKEELNAKGIH